MVKKVQLRVEKLHFGGVTDYGIPITGYRSRDIGISGYRTTGLPEYRYYVMRDDVITRVILLLRLER